MLRRHTEFGFYAFDIHKYVGHGVNEGNMLVYQLGHVFVASRDDHILLMANRLRCQSTNHVVGLNAVNNQ